MTGRLIPALRWADEHGSRNGCCIGCGRHGLEPHTSDCCELADIIRRAKEDNAMPAEYDENTPLGKITMRAWSAAIDSNSLVQQAVDAASVPANAIIADAYARLSPRPVDDVERNAARQSMVDAHFGPIGTREEVEASGTVLGCDPARAGSDQSIIVEYVTTRDMIGKPLYLTEYGVCPACGAHIIGTRHKCPVNWGPVSADERIRLDDAVVRHNHDAQVVKSLVDAASLHDAGVRSTRARQLMGILGDGTAERLAASTRLVESIRHARDEAIDQRDMARQGMVDAIKQRDAARHDLDVAKQGIALATDMMVLATATIARLQAEFAALQPPAPEPKEKAVARAIGATIAGWRPVV